MIERRAVVDDVLQHLAADHGVEVVSRQGALDGEIALMDLDDPFEGCESLGSPFGLLVDMSLDPGKPSQDSLNEDTAARSYFKEATGGAVFFKQPEEQRVPGAEPGAVLCGSIPGSVPEGVVVRQCPYSRRRRRPRPSARSMAKTAWAVPMGPSPV